MRYSGENQGVSANFIAGTYVVLMGFDATEEAREGLQGFAVHRVDKTENEQYWLSGFRTFEASYPNPPRGALVSTQQHPVQDFVWSDFTAKPEHEYVYKVVPVYGQPKNLRYRPTVEVEVATEKEDERTHAVYFNRGVIGSQAYARKFHNANPDVLQGAEKEAAFKWLSRGLEEAMLAFIGQANDRRFGLRAAVYEFSWEPAIAAFGEALKNGGDVQIVYDARIPTSDKKKIGAAKKRVAALEKLLKKYKLDAVSTPRTDSGNLISHNKYIVLLDQGEPVSVWTGSTNFTESGIFGQSNVGHVVRNAAVAKAYLDYWTRLQADPAEKTIRVENVEATPDIAGHPPKTGVTSVFSPRTNLDMLNWYAGELGEARSLTCFTAAFGVNKVFLEVLSGKQSHLNYLFLDKWAVRKDLAEKTKEELGHDRYNQVAVGSHLEGDVLSEYLADRWAKETFNPLSATVRYVHTKYMLVDPLGDDPVVITGSANFSDASTTGNDENMIVIRGDKRVADIYLGEFMRLWQHYRFRYVESAIAGGEMKGNDQYKPNYLDPTPKWSDPYFRKGSVKFMKRQAFAAPAAK